MDIIGKCYLSGSEHDVPVGPTEKGKMLDITRDKPIKVAVRVVVPVRDHPKFNFVGKLLGPKGNSMKRLQEETMCKMAVLGRGSVRDRKKEEELRVSGDPRYTHLFEDLHVEISTFAPPAEAHARIAYALAEVRRFLVPDYHDDIRQEQMWEMQALNTSSSNSSASQQPPSANTASSAQQQQQQQSPLSSNPQQQIHQSPPLPHHHHHHHQHHQHASTLAQQTAPHIESTTNSAASSSSTISSSVTSPSSSSLSSASSSASTSSQSSASFTVDCAASTSSDNHHHQHQHHHTDSTADATTSTSTLDQHLDAIDAPVCTSAACLAAVTSPTTTMPSTPPCAAAVTSAATCPSSTTGSLSLHHHQPQHHHHHQHQHQHQQQQHSPPASLLGGVGTVASIGIADLADCGALNGLLGSATATSNPALLLEQHIMQQQQQQQQQHQQHHQQHHHHHHQQQQQQQSVAAAAAAAAAVAASKLNQLVGGGGGVADTNAREQQSFLDASTARGIMHPALRGLKAVQIGGALTRKRPLLGVPRTTMNPTKRTVMTLLARAKNAQTLHTLRHTTRHAEMAVVASALDQPFHHQMLAASPLIL